MITWLRNLLRRRRLSSDPQDYPWGTAVFAKCARCGKALPYPPVHVPEPEEVIPGSDPLKYSIKWGNYCLQCAPRVIRSIREQSIVPKQVWTPDGRTLDNPWRDK